MKLFSGTHILSSSGICFFLLCSLHVFPEANAASIGSSNAVGRDLGNDHVRGNRQFSRQDEDGDEADLLGSFPTPRIKDFASGINGILKGLLSRNPEKLLEGSFEFIPPQVRVGVKGIFSGIAGRPFAESTKPTKRTTPGTIIGSIIGIDAFDRKPRTSTPASTQGGNEGESEEEILAEKEAEA